MLEVTEEQFTRHREPLGPENFERALTFFRRVGPLTHWKVDTLIENAIKYDLVEPVLDVLDQHWADYLQFVPDEITLQLEIRQLIEVIYGDLFAGAMANQLGLTTDQLKAATFPVPIQSFGEPEIHIPRPHPN